MRRLATLAATFSAGVALGAAGVAFVAALAGEEVVAIAPPVVVATAEAPIVRTVRQADLELTMAVVPGLAGRNDINFYMIDVDREWKDVLGFVVDLEDREGGQSRRVEAVQLHEGHFPLEETTLAHAGPWRIAVTVTRAEVGASFFLFEFDLAHP